MAVFCLVGVATPFNHQQTIGGAHASACKWHWDVLLLSVLGVVCIAMGLAIGTLLINQPESSFGMGLPLAGKFLVQ